MNSNTTTVYGFFAWCSTRKFALLLALFTIHCSLFTVSAQKNEHYNSPLYSPRTYDPSVDTTTGLPPALDKVGIEITPASRRVYQVHREAERVRITAGSGRGREVWSFVPPSDAPGWTDAIRAVIRNSAGAR